MWFIPASRIYKSGVHSFFDSLVTMLFNYFSHTYLINANEEIIQWYDTGDLEHFRLLRRPIDDLSFGFSFSVPDQEEDLIIHTFQILGPVLSGDWPDSLHFASLPMFFTTEIGNLSSADTHERIRAGIIGSAFASYYESQLSAIKSKFTSTKAKWPSELNFARVVRNAAAHDGRIYFESNTAPSVTWRGMTYEPKNNGRQIFVGGGDMDIGSIIVLFEDMDKILYPDHWLIS